MLLLSEESIQGESQRKESRVVWEPHQDHNLPWMEGFRWAKELRVQGPRMSCRTDKCSAVSHGTGMNWAPTMTPGFCSAERERLAQVLLPRSSGPHRLNLL